MQNSEEILTSAQKARPSKTEVALTSFCLKIRFKQHLDSAPLHFLQRQSSVSSTKAQHRVYKDIACFGKSPFRPVSDVQTTMNIYNEIQETKRKEAFEDLNDKIKISWYRKKEW